MNTITVPVSVGTFKRGVARTPLVPYHNRFAEQNPILNEGTVTALARPAMKKFAEVGSGPGRSVFSAPGLFSNTLFFVSGTELYRVSTSGVATLIGELSTQPIGNISWAPVAPIGDGNSRLFIAEGGVLWVYSDYGDAGGQLEATNPIVAGNTVQIGSIYYSFTNGSVDSGSPDGSSGAPWLIIVGASLAESLTNLYEAINGEGVPGTTYTTALEPHPTVRATGAGPADLFVNAREAGPTGNSIVLGATGGAMAWTAATLEGGGDEQLRQVQVPDDAGAISIAHINGYVIVVPTQLESLKTVGRFYWIDPGEVFIDPVNFATAERSADKVHQVRVFGNMFWLLGEATTEPWQTVGDPDAPMQRFQSILFDRGSWEGTAVQVKDSLMVVDEQGGVFQIAGGQKRISRPDIEERIREAMLLEARES